MIGRTAGEKLFSNPNSKIFRRDYLQQTHDFYDKHGGKTVTLARFLPIIRTFAPFVAGVAQCLTRAFFGFSVFGTVLWVGGLVTLGLLLRQRAIHQEEPVAAGAGIILLSLVPMIIGVVRSRAAAPKPNRTKPMWSLRAWRSRRMLARHPVDPTDLWQRVRHRLPFLDGLSADEDRYLREACVLFLEDKHLTALPGVELHRGTTPAACRSGAVAIARIWAI